MVGPRVAALGLLLLAVATRNAAASAKVDEAIGTVLTLLAVAIILWVVGSMLTYHRYESGGPKGGPIEDH